MHNQERSGPSYFSYPTEWVGEGGEANRVCFTCSTPQLCPVLFSAHFSGHSSVQQALNTSMTAVCITNFAASNRWWPSDRYLWASKDRSFSSLSNVSLKKRRWKHGITALGKQCFPSSSRAIADHCDWTIINDGLFTVPSKCCHTLSSHGLTPASN